MSNARRFLRVAVRPIRNLRMIWKLLIPSLVLILLVGTTGAYWTVRFLTSKAQVNLDGDLLRRSVDANVVLRDQSLYLLESIRFAANIEGVEEAVAARDAATATRLLASVAALRPKLDLLVATDRAGAGIVEAERTADGTQVTQGRNWQQSFIADVLAGRSAGDKRSGFVTLGSRTLLAMAGPVRAGTGPTAGVIIVAIDVQTVVRDAAGRVGAPIALYDGRRLVVASDARARRTAPVVGDRPVRRREVIGNQRVESVYVGLDLQAGLRGTVRVALPADPAFAPVRGAGSHLVIVLVAAIVAGALLAAFLSRLVLGQVKLLVDTNRALGRGDLSARAHVLGNDELGELAQGLNLMAEQLQAGYSELEMRVEARTEELRQMHQARSDFFAAIGHEFRTPLFAIKGHAELMLDDDFRPRDDEWVAEFGSVIRDAADDVLTRVDEILELARSASGQMELDLEDLSVTAAFAEVRGQMAALARRADLTLTIDIASSLPMVSADATRFRQIVLNLVSNAVKYTPPHGRVAVTAEATDLDVVVRVHDTGVGIPAEAAGRIFEPFYRVEGTHVQHGESSSGLGLALTKRLVEMHGGTISFSSEPGLGTTFEVRIPRAASARRRRRPADAVTAAG